MVIINLALFTSSPFPHIFPIFPPHSSSRCGAPPETAGRFFSSNSRCARVRLEAGRDQRNSTAQFIVDSIHHHQATTQRRGTTDTKRQATKTAMNGHNNNHDETVSITSWRWLNTGLRGGRFGAREGDMVFFATDVCGRREKMQSTWWDSASTMVPLASRSVSILSCCHCHTPTPLLMSTG